MENYLHVDVIFPKQKLRPDLREDLDNARILAQVQINGNAFKILPRPRNFSSQTKENKKDVLCFGGGDKSYIGGEVNKVNKFKGKNTENLNGGISARLFGKC